ncbi:MAG: O-antigen ligase family protein [Candidatus Schekmanbacteria bacterium]|nr:O-antigen ligase family protein [Candidatus Schekmanbacteria bacterium]
MMSEKKIKYIWTSFDLFVISFIALIIFQMLPLPVSLVKLFSPHTVELVRHLISDTSANPRFLKISIVPWETQGELIKVLTYAMIYLLIINNFNSLHKMKKILVSISIIGGIEAVYGLIQYISGDEMLFRFTRLDHAKGRLIGTFPSADHFSAYLQMCIFCTLGYLMYIGDFGGFASGRKQKLSFIDKVRRFFLEDDKWEGKVALFISIISMCTAIVFTKSRAGMLSLIISIICFTFITRIKFSSKWSVAIVGIILVITVLIGAWIGMTPVFDRYFQINPNEEFEEGRPSIWVSTFNIFRDFPIFGSGLGTFVHMYPSYTTRNNQGWVNHAHNDWLEILSDTGIAGFGIVIAGFFYLTFKGFFKIFITKEKQLIWVFIGNYMAIFSIAIHCITDFNLKTTADSFLLVVIIAIFILLSRSSVFLMDRK